MLAELLNDLRYRLRALTRGADLNREMEAEIEAHLEREAEALERQGLPAAEARRQARLAFGGLEGLKERSRDERGTRRLEDYRQDTGYAWRRIRRSPALSLTIVALLALTIGSATVVFSVVNAVLRLPEIGVRVALGATRRQIYKLVLREAAMMTAVGVCSSGFWRRWRWGASSPTSFTV